MFRRNENPQIQEGTRRLALKGQSLTEYALVLVLVGLVVILALALFGENVQKQYCKIVFSVDPNVDAPYCEAIDVSCTVLSTSPFRMEAQVTDNVGEDNVTQVQFYLDGSLYNTEVTYRYCLQAGDGACQNYLGPKGEHEFSAVASDADGNTGTCSLTTTVP